MQIFLQRKQLFPYYLVIDSDFQLESYLISLIEVTVRLFRLGTSSPINWPYRSVIEIFFDRAMGLTVLKRQSVKWIK